MVVARLKFLRDRRGEVFVLDPSTGLQDWVLGRSPSSHIFSGGFPYTSRRHCAFMFREGQYYLKDLGTSNGTYICDTKVTDEITLKSGDRISIGGPAFSNSARLVLLFQTAESDPINCITVEDSGDEDDINDANTDNDDDDDIIMLEPPEEASVRQIENEPVIVPIKVEYSHSESPIILNEDDYGEVTNESRYDVIEISDDDEPVEPVTSTREEADEPDPEELLAMMDAFLKTPFPEENAPLTTDTSEEMSSSQLIRTYDALEADLLTQQPVASTSTARPGPTPSPSPMLFPLADYTCPDSSASSAVVATTSRTLPIMPPPIIPAVPLKKRRHKKKKENKDRASPSSLQNIREARKEKLREIATAKNPGKDGDKEPKKLPPVKIKITNRSRSMLVSSESQEPPPLNKIRRLSHLPSLDSRIRSTTDVSKSSNAIKSCIRRPNSTESRSVVFDDSRNEVRPYAIDEGNKLLKISGTKIPKSGGEVVTDIIFDITSWNAAWLDESKTIKELPPSIKKLRLVPLPKRFRHHMEYCYLFKPLLLMELWTIMAQRWKKIEPNRFPVAVMSLVRNSTRGDLCNVHCQALAQSNETGCVSRHDLVIIFLNETGGNSRPVIGIVAEVQSAPVCHELDLHSCLRSRSAKSGGRVLMNVIIVIKHRELSFDLTDVMVLKVIGPFKSQMRNFEIISTILSSPVKDLVMTPTIKQLPPPAEEPVIYKDNLDEKQKLMLLRLTAACRQPEPLLQIVTGPPGTGKTQLAAALVMQLIMPNLDEESPRVVVCFPQLSLSALDRFHHALKELRKHYVTTIRRSFSFKLYNGGSLRRNSNSGMENDGVALEDADIIICTVSDCGGTSLRQALAKSSRPLICIMDEAGLSFEPESAVPLLLPTKHFILFGDVKQNQTQVYSKSAAKCGLRLSLLGRIDEVNRGANNVCQLNTQYRMNPQISKLAREIGGLVGMEDNAQRKSHLKPVVTLVSSCAANDSRRQDTIDIVKIIIDIIKFSEPNLKITILTSCNKTTDVIKERLDGAVSAHYYSSYRGREADVVLFVLLDLASSVHLGNFITNKILRKEDVTFIMTRARYSFIQIIDQACSENYEIGSQVDYVSPSTDRRTIQELIISKPRLN